MNTNSKNPLSQKYLSPKPAVTVVRHSYCLTLRALHPERIFSTFVPSRSHSRYLLRQATPKPAATLHSQLHLSEANEIFPTNSFFSALHQLSICSPVHLTAEIMFLTRFLQVSQRLFWPWKSERALNSSPLRVQVR